MIVADTTEQATRAQLARAQKLRQAVLKCAFEGKLVPHDPRDEPASRLRPRACLADRKRDFRDARYAAARDGDAAIDRLVCPAVRRSA